MSHAQLRAQAQIPLILAPAVAASLRRKQLWAKGAATHGVRTPALGSKGVAQLVAEQLALERLALRAAKEQHASARAAAELKVRSPPPARAPGPSVRAPMPTRRAACRPPLALRSRWLSECARARSGCARAR